MKEYSEYFCLMPQLCETASDKLNKLKLNGHCDKSYKETVCEMNY